MAASSYPRYEGDQAAIFLRELASHLGRAGHRVDVLAPHDPLVRPDLHDSGVGQHYFRYPHWQRRLAYGSGILPNLRAHPSLWLQLPGFVAALQWRLAACARALQPDVLHAHWILPQGLAAVRVGRRLGLPVVVSAHGGDAFALQGGPLARLKRHVLRSATAWTSNTEATAEASTAGGEVPAPEIVPMGVRISHFRTGDGERVRKATGERRRIILFVGRLVEKKGLHVLLEALFALPPAQREGACLWIAGDGAERPRLEAMCQRHGAAGQVRFLGAIDNSELRHYYAAADLFVAPSIADRARDTEGQGVVLLEAAAAGRPILASDAGGIPETLAYAHSYALVRSGDVTAWTTALERFLVRGEPAYAPGPGDQERFIERYDWPRVAARFGGLYSRVTAA